MSSPVSDRTDLRKGVRAGAAACGATTDVQSCTCAPWLASGCQAICEDEIPVDGPTAISVIVEGRLAE